MIDKESYIKVNVKHTIYNCIARSFFKNQEFYKCLYHSCINHDRMVVSNQDYYKACWLYVQEMKKNDKAIKKFIRQEKERFYKPTWKEEIKEFNCKNDKEFFNLVKSII